MSFPVIKLKPKRKLFLSTVCVVRGDWVQPSGKVSRWAWSLRSFRMSAAAELQAENFDPKGNFDPKADGVLLITREVKP